MEVINNLAYLVFWQMKKKVEQMNFYMILLTNIHNIVHYLGNLAYNVWYYNRKTSNISAP